MNLLDASLNAEEALILELRRVQHLVDDTTGKGLEAERLVQNALLTPNLPPTFRCVKGEVVHSTSPGEASAPLDRVIYDSRIGSPLLHREESAHSTLPIEVVAGVVEITLKLDATKLREDIERATSVRRVAKAKRTYLIDVPGTTAMTVPIARSGGVAPRNFIIGLPADPWWKPKTIAERLRAIQREIGSPAHVAVLYVLGIGVFGTLAVEQNDPNPYRIYGSLGPERFLHFSVSFRSAFERWGELPEGWRANLNAYLPQAEPSVLAE